MRASAPLLTVVGTAVGAVAAVAAYQAGAGGATETVSSGNDQASETTTVAPTATRPTFLPCEKGTKLRKGVCVRVKKKVVVVFDPAPVLPAVGVVPATSARSRDNSGHESGDDRPQSRPEPAEHADDDDRDETEHSEDHESEDSDEVEDRHDEDTHEVESED